MLCPKAVEERTKVGIMMCKKHVDDDGMHRPAEKELYMDKDGDYWLYCEGCPHNLCKFDERIHERYD